MSVVIQGVGSGKIVKELVLELKRVLHPLFLSNFQIVFLNVRSMFSF